MNHSVFESSGPKSLPAKIRSSSQYYCTPLNNSVKLHLPPHPRMGFALWHLWSVWGCCWAGEEAVHGPPWQQRSLLLPSSLNCTVCSVLRSEQLVFQSNWILLQFDLFLEIRYTFQRICFEALGYLNHFLVYFPRHKRYHVWNMWNENVKVFGWILSTENKFAYCSFSVKTLK